MRLVGLVRQSMPAQVEREHAVGASPVAAEQQTRMPIRVTGTHNLSQGRDLYFHDI